MMRSRLSLRQIAVDESVLRKTLSGGRIHFHWS